MTANSIRSAYPVLTQAAYLNQHVARYAHYIRLTRNVLMSYAYPYEGYACLPDVLLGGLA